MELWTLITANVLLSVLASADYAAASGGANDLSFLVIADMHDMSNFIWNPSNMELKDKLTTILQNIRDNYVGGTDIVVSPSSWYKLTGARLKATIICLLSTKRNKTYPFSLVPFGNVI